MSRSERIVPGYCPNCKSEDCECMGSPVVPCAVCGEVGIPLNEAGASASEAERLLRLTCERLVGTPVAEQSSSLADISLAIDAALHRIAAAPAPALPDDTDDEPVNCGPLDDVRTFTLVPAPALPEASVLGWATLAVALLQRHSTAWEHDPGQGDDDCDEDCRACEYEALLRTGRAALAGNHPEIPESSPAPLPEAVAEAAERLRIRRNGYGYKAMAPQLIADVDALLSALDLRISTLADVAIGPKYAFFAEHGPRLVALVEAAVEMREAEMATADGGGPPWAYGPVVAHHSDCPGNGPCDCGGERIEARITASRTAFDAIASPANGAGEEGKKP